MPFILRLKRIIKKPSEEYLKKTAAKKIAMDIFQNKVNSSSRTEFKLFAKNFCRLYINYKFTSTYKTIQQKTNDVTVLIMTLVLSKLNKTLDSINIDLLIYTIFDKMYATSSIQYREQIYQKELLLYTNLYMDTHYNNINTINWDEFEKQFYEITKEKIDKQVDKSFPKTIQQKEVETKVLHFLKNIYITKPLIQQFLKQSSFTRNLK